MTGAAFRPGYRVLGEALAASRRRRPGSAAVRLAGAVVLGMIAGAGIVLSVLAVVAGALP